MSGAQFQDEIEQDLRKSPGLTVIYLEGKTDVEPFLSLLGVKSLVGGEDRFAIHQGILIKGCVRKGSGSQAVKARVDAGTELKGQGRIYGVVDGDGQPFNSLAAQFDDPYPGPLFVWKAYCIENLLTKTGWPSAWGEPPDWEAELLGYAPYVALNRLGLGVRESLYQMGLDGFIKPDGPLKPSEHFTDKLDVGSAELQADRMKQVFEEELSHFRTMVRQNLNEAHALINGKWLIDHFAPRFSGLNNAKQCHKEWLAHARSVGGLPEVREWWERVTGSPP